MSTTDATTTDGTTTGAHADTGTTDPAVHPPDGDGTPAPPACARCGVRYRPERTDGACPVCRLVPDGFAIDDGPASRFAIEDTRTAVVLFMSATNFLALALLWVLLVH